MLEQPTAHRVGIMARTLRAWVRGVVELGRLPRLSEALNHAGVDFLTLLDGEVLPLEARTWPSPQPRLYLNKAAILFVYQTTPGDRSRLAGELAVQKSPVSVGVYVSDYQVQGQLFLADRVAWEQYLSVLRDRFLSLTSATIVPATDREDIATADFVAINREHLLALYPLE